MGLGTLRVGPVQTYPLSLTSAMKWIVTLKIPGYRSVFKCVQVCAYNPDCAFALYGIEPLGRLKKRRQNERRKQIEIKVTFVVKATSFLKQRRCVVLYPSWNRDRTPKIDRDQTDGFQPSYVISKEKKRDKKAWSLHIWTMVGTSLMISRLPVSGHPGSWSRTYASEKNDIGKWGFACQPWAQLVPSRGRKFPTNHSETRYGGPLRSVWAGRSSVFFWYRNATIKHYKSLSTFNEPQTKQKPYVILSAIFCTAESASYPGPILAH